MSQISDTVEVIEDIYVRTSIHAAALLAILSPQAQDGVLVMTLGDMCEHVAKYPEYRNARRVRTLVKSLEYAGYMKPVEKSGKTVTAWKIDTGAVVGENGEIQ